MRVAGVVVVAGLVALCAAAFAQQPAAPAGFQVLRGVVSADDESRTFLRRARVSAEWTDGRSDPVFTDDRGRFEIVVPRVAAYTLAVSKPGFAPHKVLRDGGVSVDPADVRLPRGAVIAGTVLDSGGEPVVGVGVIVRRTDPSGAAYSSGEWVSDTDDRGEFRVGSLPAGPYAVVLSGRRTGGAVPGSGWQSGIYINAPVNPDTVVRVRAGEELSVARVLELLPVVAAATTSPASAAVEQGARAARTALGLSGTARLSGRVIGANGRPVPRAVVLVTALVGAYQASKTSDAEGRYQIADMPPGAYRILVGGSGTNRVEMRDGQSIILIGAGDRVESPDRRGRVVTVGEGERLDGVDVVVPRGGVITGSVVDEFGESLEGLTVQLWQARWNGGQTVVVPVPGVAVRRSDDRGHYRLYGVAPGTYYVAVAEEVPQAAGEFFAPAPLAVFHPGSVSVSDALPVEIGAGTDLADVTVVFSPGRLGEIQGHIVDSSGAPFEGELALSARRPPSAPVLQPRRAQVRNGTFALDRVAPGEYVLHALGRRRVSDLPPVGEIPMEFGMAAATVTAGDTALVSMQTARGSSMRGRVVVKGGASAPPSGLTLVAMPAGPDLFPISWRRIARVLSDGSFEMTDLIGPVRVALNSGVEMADLVGVGLVRSAVNYTAPGWRIESVYVDGVNAADDPVTFGSGRQSRTDVEVVLSKGGAEIAGQVVGGAGAASLALVFPTDPDRWHDQSRYLTFAAADRNGRFTATGLPEGEYWVVAVDAAGFGPGLGDWRAPDVLTSLIPGARRVSVSEGGRATVQVNLTR